MSLNLNPISENKDALFTDLRGLRANVILFQDHRLSEGGADDFPHERGTKNVPFPKAILYGRIGVPVSPKRVALRRGDACGAPALLRESAGKIH